ncbi:antirestriction protein [Xenorhabdus griffiniae]|uniref:antirestriction protein n=1 Tax=Xenorhabdus griffiniae TaxID=351672 RepID=UPI0030CF60ED
MWYICPPLEADIIVVDDEGYLIHPGTMPVTRTGNSFPSGRGSPSFLFLQENMMQKSELIMLDSPALSAAFPGKKPLERLFLGFLIVNTASTLCKDYPSEQWTGQQVSESLAYMVPTSAKNYPVYLSDRQLTVTLSADAFGLTVTSIVLARIAALNERDACRLCELREYAKQHPENALIGSVMTLGPHEDFISPSLIENQNNHAH